MLRYTNSITNQANINETNTQVPQIGHGNSLPVSGGAAEFSIVHIPSDGVREIGDGTDAQQIQYDGHIQRAQRIPQQPHNISAQTQATPTPSNSQPIIITPKTKNKKRIKASLKVASLNMRGRFNNGNDKWTRLREIIKSQKIGVLVLQETHLTLDEEEILNTRFEKDWLIISSINPNSPNARGVAIILNKRYTNSTNIEKKEIIPGRALQITMPWRKELKLTILAIYAPNDSGSNEAFWSEIREKIDPHRKPDIMLGDFNLVEDALDRLPAHRDHQGATEELANLKSVLNFQDGWRHENPDEKNYTYTQSEQQGGAKSRIDRIYVTNYRLKYCKEWELNAPGIPTDHKLVSVRISDKKLPYIGKGRWTIPLFLLKDKKLNESIQKSGKDLEDKMERNKDSRTDANNSQTLFREFKDKIISEYRKAAKETKPKLTKNSKPRRKTPTDL
jgi:exonuclease III